MAGSGGLWDPREHLSDARKIERLEEHVGRLEDRLIVCKDALEFALTFYRASFQHEDPVSIAPEWAEEIEVKLSHALTEARRSR